MIHLCEPATADNFDADLYLLANPDIGAAGGGEPGYPSRHFFTWGINEGRLQINRRSLQELETARRDKLRRLGVSLPFYEMDYLGTQMAIATASDGRLPIKVDLSIQDYDPAVAEMVDGDPSQLFLDVGAGLTQSYRDNVVYSDIAAMPTTDVLCFADSLPFDDNAFDGAVCRSVLEHVPNPFLAAAELVRVVRPGGRILVDWPFLQPVHGYPDHYFNSTAHGGESLFEGLGATVETSIPDFLHPVFTLRWLLWEWQSGLSEVDRQAFLGVTLGEMIGQTPMAHLENSPWARELSAEVCSRISAGTRLMITNGPG